MDNIIIANYPRSGSRYLSALISCRFRELNNYRSNAYCSMNEILKESQNNLIMKITTDHIDQVPYKTIYLVRDPRDVIATLHKEDKIEISELCDNTIIGWIKHNYSMMYLADRHDILFVSYENIIEDESFSIKRIGEYLGLTPRISNKSRELEIKEGLRSVGIYKEVLSQRRIRQIEETVYDCLNDLEEYI